MRICPAHFMSVYQLFELIGNLNYKFVSRGGFGQ
jgi:hypothetical protein